MRVYVLLNCLIFYILKRFLTKRSISVTCVMFPVFCAIFKDKCVDSIASPHFLLAVVLTVTRKICLHRVSAAPSRNVSFIWYKFDSILSGTSELNVEISVICLELEMTMS